MTKSILYCFLIACSFALICQPVHVLSLKEKTASSSVDIIVATAGHDTDARGKVSKSETNIKEDDTEIDNANDRADASETEDISEPRDHECNEMCDVAKTQATRINDKANTADEKTEAAGNNLASRRVTVKSAANKQPNVILMLVDDLGYGDLSSFGHPTSRTPVIDQIASRSKVFTQFYVTSPVCSPSRASLLTGRYQVRSGVYPFVFLPDSIYGMPASETTIAEMLKTKGYRTMITGKWHLGVGDSGEYLPTQQGFDDYLGVPYSHDMCPCYGCFPGNLPCYDTCWASNVSCPLFNNTVISEQPVDLTTLTERLVQRAKLFLRESVNSEQPFFLYMPFMHVHHPQYSSSEFEGKSIRGTFGDSLAELDDSVHQIIKQLDDLAVTNDTIIFFLSDNGPSMLRQERGGCSGPLRCGKGTTWEGGVRVPAFVYWPGTIQPERSAALVSSLDVLPTLASLTGADVQDLVLDGVDMTSLLLNQQQDSPRAFMAVYPSAPTPSTGPHAVVHGHYKAHFFTKGSDLSDNANYDAWCTDEHPLTEHQPPLLYDLSVDPGERWNIANDAQYQDLLETIRTWRDEHMASMTWHKPLTDTVNARAQPCCNNNKNCEPFPQCCDCQTAASNL